MRSVAELKHRAGTVPIFGSENGTVALNARGIARRDGRTAALCLRAAILPAGRTWRRSAVVGRADSRRRARADRAGGRGRPGRVSAAVAAGRAVRRMRARPHRHRDHARLSRQVPLLPEHDDQAAAAVPQGRDDRPGGPRTVSQHRLQRNLAALALHQRLSALRRVDAAAARDVSPAGRGHFAAEPADQRAVARWSAI